MARRQNAVCIHFYLVHTNEIRKGPEVRTRVGAILDCQKL